MCVHMCVCVWAHITHTHTHTHTYVQPHRGPADLAVLPHSCPFIPEAVAAGHVMMMCVFVGVRVGGCDELLHCI